MINTSSVDIKKYEERVVQEVKNKGSKLKPIEIIAEIQHYGGSTRLIDFTREFAFALFFAFCDFPRDSASVWALSKKNLPFMGNYEINETDGDLSLFEIDFQRRFEEEKVFQFYVDEFVFSDHTSLQEFINEKMESYPKEMEEYKIGTLDFITSKEFEFTMQYQRKHEVQTVRPGEVNLKEKFVQESLKQYFIDIKNQRMLNQKGLFLFSSSFDHTFEENIFLGKKMEDIEGSISLLTNPNWKVLEGLCSNVYNSQRGVIKFKIDASLTKFILNTLREGKYDIEMPDLWDHESGKPYLETEKIGIDGSPITFKTMFPGIDGFYKNLTHRLLE